jgi:hypothetical protein
MISRMFAPQPLGSCRATYCTEAAGTGDEMRRTSAGCELQEQVNMSRESSAAGYPGLLVLRYENNILFCIFVLGMSR